MGLGKLGKAAAWGFLLGSAGVAPGTGAEAAAAIVGGRSITIREAPWQLLVKTREEGGAEGQCGAVWIGGRWALTAAHCVEGNAPADISLFAGITRLREADTAPRIGARRVIPNPEFPDRWKDIALVELDRDVASDLARPIPFATAEHEKAGLLAPGREVIATGWGGINRNGRLADSLQSLATKVADTARWVLKIVPPGGTAPAGACGGDSGGPCVVKDATGTGWLVAGLSSYIESHCGDPASPSSYAKVSGFTSWIRQHIGTPVGLAVRPRASGSRGAGAEPLRLVAVDGRSVGRGVHGAGGAGETASVRLLLWAAP